MTKKRTTVYVDWDNWEKALKVLHNQGTTASEVVDRLVGYIAQHEDIPDVLRATNDRSTTEHKDREG